MKKLAFIFMLALGFAWNSHAQTWTYVQDSIGTYCSSNTSSCTMNGGNMLPTTAGTIWIVIVGTTNNVNISSVTGGGGTWTICSTCHVYDPTVARAISVAYNLTGNAGTGSVTVNLTGNSGTVFSGNFFEFLPPAGSTASFDTAATGVSTSCTTCTGVGLNLSATDLVLQRIAANSPSSWHAWSAPYQTLPAGEGIHLNAPPGAEAAPTVTTTGTGGVSVGIAFKSTAGTFTPPPAGPISLVNYMTTLPGGIGCSPTCQLTIPATSAGHLLFIESADFFGSYISSISGGGTWVVPTGSNSCRIGTSSIGFLSCAYALSSTAGVTTLNITMTGSAQTSFAVWEVASSSGTFAFDSQGSAQNAASSSPSGVSLPLTSGATDAIFQAAFVPGGTSAVTWYPLARTPGWSMQFMDANAASAALLNTSVARVPLWANQQNNATVVTGIAFKTGTATSTGPNPPTGLTAVVN